VSLDVGEQSVPAGADTLGRRHLAEMLVRARKAGSVRDAFLRYLDDRGRVVVPKLRLPVADAIALVRGAGGVAAWAHPSYDCTEDGLARLRDVGLGALEVEYPGYRRARVAELRAWASALGMAVTGGSDCHGPDQPSRAVGACTISDRELEALRRLSSEYRVQSTEY
jgi:predicted metal-dependent phosphoesterase TrpH